MQTLILGFDAFDPRRFGRLSEQGRLPNLTRYVEAGGYARFQISNPAQTEGSLALIHGPYKLAHCFGYGSHEDVYELYDLTSDPDKLDDLCGTNGPLAARLRTELEQKLSAVNRPFPTGRG